MSDFAIQFGAGALATLVGVVIGIPAALFVNRLIARWQEGGQAARERHRQWEEQLGTLRGLREEVARNERLLHEMAGELPSAVIFYTLDTSFWEAASGRQIQSLENFELVTRLSRLYYDFQHLKRKIDMQFEMHYGPGQALSGYSRLRDSLVGAILAQIEDPVAPLTEQVLQALDNEIERLRVLHKSHREESP